MTIDLVFAHWIKTEAYWISEDKSAGYSNTSKKID